jgi:hypothetical protein
MYPQMQANIPKITPNLPRDLAKGGVLVGR